MLTLIAFALALGLLIAVHEYGHYRMARLCGVKVLRFSIGFGRALLRWQPKGSSTEFVLGAFPLGGYVLMLDEREAPVPASERHLAFNTQPLRSRVAIVAWAPGQCCWRALSQLTGVQMAAPIRCRLRLIAAALAWLVASGCAARRLGRCTGGDRIV
jgi:regulator of sigma E protease